MNETYYLVPNNKISFIRDCFNLFPDKKVFKSLRYIIDVEHIKNDNFLLPFDRKAYFDVLNGKFAGAYTNWETYGDIIFKDTGQNCPYICNCPTYFYHSVVHELAHHYFECKNLYKEWKQLKKQDNKITVTSYAKKSIREFFSEHYVASTSRNGRDWLDKNRLDVLESIERLWRGNNEC